MKKHLLFLSMYFAFQTLVFAQKDTLRIAGVGDIMLGTNYPSTQYLPPNQGKDLMKAAHEILQAADVTFGNLEGVVLDDGGTPKKCSNPNACYAFRMPEYLMNNMVEAGFDVVSIANNHVGDFGEEGRKNTKKVLDKLGIYAAGLLSCPSVTFEKDGVKYGLVAFAPNSGTVDIKNIANAKKIVSDLAAQTDIVIVSFHGGAEGASHQKVTRQTETFYGENRGNVYEFSHAVVDAGADIVFGHGPHVTRAVEVYKDRFIAYSLGNFATYARFSLKGVSGIAPIITLSVNKEGKFLSGKITPIIQLGEGGVTIDSQKRAISYIRNLTKTDFPDSKLKIDTEGTISF